MFSLGIIGRAKCLDTFTARHIYCCLECYCFFVVHFILLKMFAATDFLRLHRVRGRISGGAGDRLKRGRIRVECEIIWNRGVTRFSDAPYA